jgi:DNA-binding CsgD family transcriptional regulator
LIASASTKSSPGSIGPPREVDPFLVAEMFALTPAEARLAVHLRSGLSPQAIADASRLSLATVRSQIQSIYGKTGVNRRTDLIWLLEGLAGFETLSQ